MSIQAICHGAVTGAGIEVTEGDRKRFYRSCAVEDAGGGTCLVALMASTKKHRKVLKRMLDGWHVHVHGGLTLWPDQHASALGAAAVIQITKMVPPECLKDSWAVARGASA